MNLTFLPHVNASLNATSAVCLVLGLIFVKKRDVEAHKRCMLGALTASSVFLVCYIIYHFEHGATKFPGEGLARPVYFTILISHTILAVAMVPFVIITFRRAFRGDVAGHKKIAKITFPMWLYVSVTGVIVYWMLYHLYPQTQS